MDRFDAMRTFLRVAETGNFSQVAREANVGQPAISKQVAWLETHLGVQLFHRTPRNVRPTDAGHLFYDAVLRVMRDLETAEHLIGRGAIKPSGRLSVSLSAGFGRLHVVPLLPAFQELYPDIAVDFIVTDRFVDLVEEGFDLAIRIGQLQDSALIARRIGLSPRVTVASPHYLARRGEPLTPEDLRQHACIVYAFQRSSNPWHFSGPKTLIEVPVAGPLRTNDAENVRAAVLAGLGIAQAPRWLFSEELTTGAVCEVLANYPPRPAPIHAVFPAEKPTAPKVRAFVDFVAGAFARDPCLRPE